MVTAMTLRIGLLVAVLAALVSGCSGQDSTATSSSSLTRVTTTAQDDEPSTSSRPGKTTTTTTESEAITEMVAFTSPTGNVACIIDPEFVRCDIRERDWEPPPRPVDCEFDYGQGISMSTGAKAEIVCAGDTALSDSKPLAYGASTSVGTLSCDSAEAGITCRDSSTGHGFTIAREAYRLF